MLGYHGCEPALAEALIRGDRKVADWKPSRNIYDWLGEGIYFWEDAPIRALEWSGKGGVVGAIIQLGVCLDFTDTDATDLLAFAYHRAREQRAAMGVPMPENRGKRHDLDCMVIDDLIASMEAGAGIRYQTVRSPFLEGEPAFPGSAILRESHIQIAVRDSQCIVGIFRPSM